MMMNCVPSEYSLRYLAKLSTFASSKEVSISSSIQKAAGFSLRIANKSAIAVSACSPPESRLRSWSFFPGGCAMISILQLSTSFLSERTSSALPPLNSAVNVSLKFFWIRANCSVNSRSIVAVSLAISSVKSHSAWRKSLHCAVNSSYRALTSR